MEKSKKHLASERFVSLRWTNRYKYLNTMSVRIVQHEKFYKKVRERAFVYLQYIAHYKCFYVLIYSNHVHSTTEVTVYELAKGESIIPVTA